ncbi:hypothetical protein GCM10010116_58000 [Microbispora rosea subsp. aerata]|nr:hypothetical protein GCM10010116_58000 [Microbispora rosea subsp. aerata]GLJ86738.1 hypothetical protein GCM10017588_54770 [Microbispora rosea subsp. aerata]
MRRAARAAAGRDRPPGRTPGRRAGDAPRCGGAARRRLDIYKRDSANISGSSLDIYKRDSANISGSSLVQRGVTTTLDLAALDLQTEGDSLRDNVCSDTTAFAIKRSQIVIHARS